MEGLAQLAFAPTVFHPKAAAKINSMTDRQREVLAGIAKGDTTKGIALSLNISPKTVEHHRKVIQRRSATYSIADLTRLAIMGGLVPLFQVDRDDRFAVELQP